MSTWHNNDGLFIKFGTREATPALIGEVKTFGPVQTLEFALNMSSLTDTNAIISDAVKLPKNIVVQSVETFVTTPATSSGTGTLDLGIIDNDRTSNHDDDAILAAYTLANMDEFGEWVTIHRETATFPGVLLTQSSTLTKNVYITAGFDTGAFQAGVVRFRINYRHLS